MNDKPIVGVLAAATRDHLLLDVPLHIALCGKNPKGRVLCETWGSKSKFYTLDNVMKVWNQSTRQCRWCLKRLKKMQKEK